MKKSLVTAALALAATGLLPAAAQTIYRCGNTYSRQPCEGAKVVAAQDVRSDQDAQQARLQTQQDAKRADAMEKSRLKEEAKPVAAYIPPPKVEAPAVEDKRVLSRPKKPPYFTAVVPATKKTAKKKKASQSA